MIGGFFGEGSYATAYPDEGNIYLKAVYNMNNDGTFSDPVELTKGLLITKDQYTYIEFFDIPNQKEVAKNGE